MSARKVKLSGPYVLSVARSVCRRTGSNLRAVLGPNGTRAEARVRAAIWRIIFRATDCSANELARVWGCDVGSILRVHAAPSEREQRRADIKKRMAETPDSKTRADLQWMRTLAFIYGPERAGAILAGRDPKTNEDLAAWRRLGTGASS